MSGLSKTNDDDKLPRGAAGVPGAPHTRTTPPMSLFAPVLDRSSRALSPEEDSEQDGFSPVQTNETNVNEEPEAQNPDPDSDPDLEDYEYRRLVEILKNATADLKPQDYEFLSKAVQTGALREYDSLLKEPRLYFVFLRRIYQLWEEYDRKNVVSTQSILPAGISMAISDASGTAQRSRPMGSPTDNNVTAIHGRLMRPGDRAAPLAPSERYVVHGTVAPSSSQVNRSSSSEITSKSAAQTDSKQDTDSETLRRNIQRVLADLKLLIETPECLEPAILGFDVPPLAFSKGDTSAQAVGSRTKMWQQIQSGLTEFSNVSSLGAPAVIGSLLNRLGPLQLYGVSHTGFLPSLALRSASSSNILPFYAPQGPFPSPDASDQRAITFLLHSMYTSAPLLRPILRAHLVGYLIKATLNHATSTVDNAQGNVGGIRASFSGAIGPGRAGRDPSDAAATGEVGTPLAGVGEILKLLTAIVSGYQPESESQSAVAVASASSKQRRQTRAAFPTDDGISIFSLATQLLPLLVWNGQAGLQYHEHLTEFLHSVCDMYGAATELFIKFFLGPCWRSGDANTSVLLIQLVEALLMKPAEKKAGEDLFRRIREELWPRVLEAMDSPHSLTAQRALQLWRNSRFVELTLCDLVLNEVEPTQTKIDDQAAARRHLQSYLQLCFGERSWNPTVNRMRGAVIRATAKALQAMALQSNETGRVQLLACLVPMFKQQLEAAVLIPTDVLNEITNELIAKPASASSSEPARPRGAVAPPKSATAPGYAHLAIACKASGLSLDRLSTDIAAEDSNHMFPLLIQALESTADWLCPLNDADKAEDSFERLARSYAVIPPEIPAVAETGKPLEYTSFVFGEQIGAGSFASIIRAQLIDRLRPNSLWRRVALKVMHKELIDVSPQAQLGLSREIYAYRTLKHPNIIALLGECRTKSALYLVLELATKGDLHSQIVQFGTLDPTYAAFVFAEVINALHYMHNTTNLIYRDLKPENVMVFDSRHVKLGDFGSCIRIDEVGPDENVEGTLEYLAPEFSTSFNCSTPGAPLTKSQLGGKKPREMREGSRATPASDLWSLGCLLYEILVGQPPVWAAVAAVSGKAYEGEGREILQSQDFLSEKEQSLETLDTDADDSEEKAPATKSHVHFDDVILGRSSRHRTLRIPATVPVEAAQLIKALLRFDPRTRLGVKQLSASDPAANAPGTFTLAFMDHSDPSATKTGPTPRYQIDYKQIAAHPFFSRYLPERKMPSNLIPDEAKYIKLTEDEPFPGLATTPAPVQTGGQVTRKIDPQWTRRKNSVMWSPLPPSFDASRSSASGAKLPPITVTKQIPESVLHLVKLHSDIYRIENEEDTEVSEDSPSSDEGQGTSDTESGSEQKANDQQTLRRALNVLEAHSQMFDDLKSRAVLQARFSKGPVRSDSGIQGPQSVFSLEDMRNVMPTPVESPDEGSDKNANEDEDEDEDDEEDEFARETAAVRADIARYVPNVPLPLGAKPIVQGRMTNMAAQISRAMGISQAKPPMPQVRADQREGTPSTIDLHGVPECWRQFTFTASLLYRFRLQSLAALGKCDGDRLPAPEEWQLLVDGEKENISFAYKYYGPAATVLMYGEQAVRRAVPSVNMTAQRIPPELMVLLNLSKNFFKLRAQ